MLTTSTIDMLAFFIRRQNAAIIFTKHENCTLCEAFEVSPSGDAVEATPGPLICYYPGSAVETPNEVFDDGGFQFELANFLSRPNVVDPESPLPPPPDPQYINALLNGVLRSVGRTVPPVTKRTAPLASILRGGPTADVLRVNKHVRDHVGCVWTGVDVWRRSPLWLLIRVAIQMSVNRSVGRASYKRFTLFFACTLARDANNTTLPSDLLHLMSSKILRRLSKLGSSTPDWLSAMALKTCTCLREILDARWEKLNVRPWSPFRNPSQHELTRDTQLSLLDSHTYIRNALASLGPQLHATPFHPSHRRRGTFEDFLSSNGTFFEEAYDADPDITVHDVEQSVEEGIDNWLAFVTNVDEASAQLEILMDKYMMKAYGANLANPEDMSIRLLTAIELYVALDKLVVKEIPTLADYPPEIPITFLERLRLRKATSLHRLSCAYQYLSVRHSRSRPGWSLLSAEFTEDSFPVRYYDQSPHLQQLKARIEQDAMKGVAGRTCAQLEGASLAHTAYDGSGEYQQHLPGRRLAECAQSPLPDLPLHAKVVVFELQCPACVRIWRSAAPRILHHFYRFSFDDHIGNREEGRHLLARVPALQPYFVEHHGPALRVQIHFTYFYPEEFQSRNSPMLRYAFHHPKPYDSTTLLEDSLSIWQPGRRYEDWELSLNLRYGLSSHYECPSCRDLEKYVDDTSHTSNDVLSAQADCPADLSLDEFIAFAHLRSGGSLQWLNALQGLRSRTLNFRRHQVHYLLAHAAFQVGPLDMNTGAWIWHQELQDPCFCNALLDELDSLVVDVGARSIDGVLMSTVSLLLTRVLASSPSEDLTDRVCVLLRSVRRKTFSWVQELSYDLAEAPPNEERMNLLLAMAATCRSTFDVDPATLRKLFHSAEDVDALLSCAFLIHALRPTCMFNSGMLITLSTSLTLTLQTSVTNIHDYSLNETVGCLPLSRRS